MKENKNNEKLFQNIELKAKIENINSKFNLAHIFNNLQKHKFFNIIKYNKALQNRLDLNIKNYKECSELFTPIEIEIIPAEKKYGKFINIKYEKQKIYTHIYFNDSNKEIKKYYLKKEDKITKIKIIIDYQIKSFEFLFSNVDCIESIYFRRFKRININNMRCMFGKCSSLKKIDFSNFKTDNVEYMSYMFGKCSSLIEINLSNINTQNVNSMSYMFEDCSSLKNVNISNLNNNGTKCEMIGMFQGCSSLKELNLSNFNTNNINDMSYMFMNCSSLIKLNLSSFNIINVTNMEYMFSGCSSLKELSFSFFNSNNKINIFHMFENCLPLIILNSLSFNTKDFNQKRNIINGYPF